MKLRRKVYNGVTAFMGLMAGVMLFWLMLWQVYEADDLSSALIIGAAVAAAVLREAYHQWHEEQRAKQRGRY